MSASVCLLGYTFPHFSTYLSKCDGNIILVMTRSMSYRCLCTHVRMCVLTAHACVRSLLVGHSISKFAGCILRLTIGYMCYVLVMHLTLDANQCQCHPIECFPPELSPLPRNSPSVAGARLITHNDHSSFKTRSNC
jgi:hypothetical protein